MADEKRFIIEETYSMGDFHCSDCMRVNNYISHRYCCQKIKDMHMQEQKSRAFIFKICLERMEMDSVATAMLADKKVVKANGDCIFCRNKKHHEELKWCEGKSKAELFEVYQLKKMRDVDILIDRYAEAYHAHQMSLVRNVFKRIRREMEAWNIGQGKKGQELELILKRQDHRSFRDINERHLHYEKEADQCRKNMRKTVDTEAEELLKKFRDVKLEDENKETVQLF